MNINNSRISRFYCYLKISNSLVFRVIVFNFDFFVNVVFVNKDVKIKQITTRNVVIKFFFLKIRKIVDTSIVKFKIFFL